MVGRVATTALALASLAAALPQASAAVNSESPQPNVNTATATASVYAAQKTAATYKGSPNYVGGQVFDRFVNIWFENTDYSKAAADPNFQWLASQGISLTNFYGVTHPSQPNYIAAVGGDNFGMDNDAFSQISADVSTIVDLLEDKSISWATYQEDMPYTGFEGNAWRNQKTQANDYVRKHNPPIIYNKNTSPRRLSYQKNLTQFYQDLNSQSLPQWMFITPNMTSDGHDTSVTTAGQWLRGFLGPLLSNSYFTSNTLILVTFDENHSYTIGNQLFTVLLGDVVPDSLVGTTDNKFYDHYSELATVEANWNLHTLGRWDVGANVFDLVAQVTGDGYQANTAVTGSSPSVFLNSSFAGPFNTGFQSAAYPIPNTNIVSPGTGRTVLPSIVNQYSGSQTSKNMYYKASASIPDGQHPPAGYAYNNVNN
ncbi:phosphoesterase-domain-containing protein [Dissoconium aciculare CBS 342.82]|uniref:Phosphoesterase-domain-containing protein n=1 Tax=Dissoconium aciculare CBS 342.82 TaxID=1314786 RepID=A0A6J3MKZ6_9PEZI|nr:phosphoesterase-domain-containing protein [Dissoconium aciculare CBS 342.82]KAF1827667.1 phosphoesterase-domain-containing protein [Dissoconium aciculare CBS 342.82]